MAAVAVQAPPHFPSTLPRPAMSNSLSPSPDDTTNASLRVSHLLPSVKCTSCHQSVQLTQLADHVCAPRAPSPAASLAPSARTGSAALPTPAITPVRAARTPSPAPPRPMPSSAARPPASGSSRSPTPIQTQALPSVSSEHAPRSLSPASISSPTRSAAARIPSPAPSLHQARAQQPTPPPQPTMHLYPGQHVPHSAPSLPPDTQSGGSAGMAGVGRRAFAAAAHAAMFAQSHRPQQQFRRHQLAPVDVETANGAPDAGHGSQGSPSFLSISSLSPHSPLSPASLGHPSPTYPPARTPSPLNPQRRPSNGSIPPREPELPLPQANLPLPVSSQPSPAPSPRPSVDLPSITPLNISDKKRSVASSISSEITPLVIPKRPEPVAPQSMSSPSITPRLPFFEKYKQLASKPPVQTAQTLPTPSPSTSTPSVSSPPPQASPLPPSPGGSELAYRRSDSSSAASSMRKGTSLTSSHHRPERSPTDPGPSNLRSTRSTVNSVTSVYSQMGNDVVFPMQTPSGSRQASSVSSSSFGASPRSTSKSTGALETSVMETLLEEPASAVSSSSSERDKVKLPQRSHTTPAATKEFKERRRKERTCVKCGEKIRDGRWIQREGSGVLCERDWKEMYLPKCRRCELPIEKHAVSSSDGQLKGKYHRDCFNCDTCREPFPDKTFYVFDGKPYCAYHYHAKNGSLCASPSCGQPIEGACAVTHAGLRFHPEHLVCDSADCNEMLEEYWEVEGRKLCERHGVAALTGSPTGHTAPDFTKMETRAAKRKTRFVDLVRGMSAGKK